AEIPDGLDWVLRVDGHTDVRPISTPQFPSNWELSSARATSVVKFLIEQGIPPNRLVAAGFGQYQPLDAGDDEIAYRRNRRIEFKLTQR
ncbi:MAG: OmpA family protein, partial [Alphaproteobacteria bacterium]|nr:OmpA family protein [Alphaproteobacteria bacterium]